VNLVRTIPSA